jgi:hypothetical protein
MGSINKLFITLQARYGNQWANQWDDERLLKFAKNEWYEELKHLKILDIKRGLENYRGDYPPNMMQFSEACKKEEDYLPSCYQDYEVKPGLLKIESKESDEYRARGNRFIANLREVIKTGKLNP